MRGGPYWVRGGPYWVRRGPYWVRAGRLLVCLQHLYCVLVCVLLGSVCHKWEGIGDYTYGKGMEVLQNRDT